MEVLARVYGVAQARGRTGFGLPSGLSGFWVLGREGLEMDLFCLKGDGLRWWREGGLEWTCLLYGLG